MTESWYCEWCNKETPSNELKKMKGVNCPDYLVCENCEQRILEGDEP